MSRLTKAMAATLLVLYGLALFHCDLEQLSGLAFLSCCEHQEAVPHQDNDCQQDACSVVESGLYRISDHQDSLPAPPLALSELLLECSRETTPETACQPPVPSVPREFAKVWSFMLRTALAPRAPSTLS